MVVSGLVGPLSWSLALTSTQTWVLQLLCKLFQSLSPLGFHLAHPKSLPRKVALPGLLYPILLSNSFSLQDVTPCDRLPVWGHSMVRAEGTMRAGDVEISMLPFACTPHSCFCLPLPQLPGLPLVCRY